MKIRTLLLCIVLALPAGYASAAPLGVYQGNGCNGVKALTTFVSWFGRDPDFVLDFFDTSSWTNMYNDAGWTVSCWGRYKRQVVFSVPMLPGGTDTLADGAAGKFDDQFRKIGELLVSRGYANAYIRLGWEFNGGWYPWAAKKDPTSWVAYWKRIVDSMRSVSGQSFRFVWCTAQGWQQIKSDTVYPGDDYVDVIAQDVYNQTWTAAVTTPEQRWNELMNQSYGLKWLRDFATAHNKPMAFPEWGTGTRPDGHGGGDDPYFIQQMAKWIGQNNVAFHGYWDFAAKDVNGKLSDGSKPLAGAAFLAAFKTVPQSPMNVGATGK